jgi:hypothetical protein
MGKDHDNQDNGTRLTAGEAVSGSESDAASHVAKTLKHIAVFCFVMGSYGLASNLKLSDDARPWAFGFFVAVAVGCFAVAQLLPGYERLSVREQDSDRKEADRVLALVGCADQPVSEASPLTPERSAKDLLLNESKPRPNKETV